jgi:hypothetical protein
MPALKIDWPPYWAYFGGDLAIIESLAIGLKLYCICIYTCVYTGYAPA